MKLCLFCVKEPTKECKKHKDWIEEMPTNDDLILEKEG